ncbi:hypothetical protein Bca52824_000936 [Brassica carinata]|uniref:Uncharacterized protein n=1 Tax=Brassica carinata TaxID=52824 RepID=A0A8X7WHT0_BRACI|nr:hypothetical protein Bca52824_000936 [Brassica carinata]
MPAIPSSSAISTSATGTKSPCDAAPFIGQDVTSEHALDVSAQHSGSSTTPMVIIEEGKATESMPPPPNKKETVLVLPASSAAPLPKGHKRNGAATETVKKRRCTKGGENETSGLLSQRRAKVCLRM